MPTNVNWPLYRSVCYLTGRGLTFGSPILQPQETNPNVYSIVVDTIQNGRTSICDTTFNIIARESLDHVFIGLRIGVIENQETLIRDAASKLKVGGHLIIYSEIDKNGPGYYPIHPKQIYNMVSSAGRWQEKDSYEIEGKSLQIFRKSPGKRGIVPNPPRLVGKRACVCRFGALGDAIILTPLLRRLKEEGYHVTFSGTPYCWPALQNNPYIDNVLMQERDAIPNPELGPYWSMWAGEYDKYVNLSESLEGDLLIVEGRKEFFTTRSWRQERCDKNYYDYTLVRAGMEPKVGEGRGELFFTNAEERKAKEFFSSTKCERKFKILWALNGSSHHKVYPLMEPTLTEFLTTHPDSVCVTVGDDLARLLEFDHDQLITMSGKWGIRESLIATKYVDLVIGPETMITNAAGCYPTPKITLLSHSTHNNLCRDWENDYCLTPDQSIAPCYPCHQLHYTKESCPVGQVVDTVTGVEIGMAPVCSVGILPLRLLARMEEVYTKWKGI